MARHGFVNNLGAGWRAKRAVEILDAAGAPVPLDMLRPAVGQNIAILARLARQGRIQRLGKGVYASAELVPPLEDTVARVVREHGGQAKLRHFVAAGVARADVQRFVDAGVLLRSWHLFRLAADAPLGVIDGRARTKTDVLIELIERAGRPLHTSEMASPAQAPLAWAAAQDGRLILVGPAVYGIPGRDHPVGPARSDAEAVEKLWAAGGGPYTRGDVARCGITPMRRRWLIEHGLLLPVGDGQWRLVAVA